MFFILHMDELLGLLVPQLREILDFCEFKILY